DFFFFSSRRRHTRFKCDWSSDVCSSDLTALGRLAGIRDCVAVVRDIGGSRQLVAFYAEADDAGTALSPQALSNHLAGQLPAYMRSEERRVGKGCKSRWTNGQ